MAREQRRGRERETGRQGDTGRQSAKGMAHGGEHKAQRAWRIGQGVACRRQLAAFSNAECELRNAE
jgi:hypothetical protein